MKSFKVCARLRHFSGSAIPPRLVLGCGSNVVDQFFMVQAVPKVGEKGYFASPNKTHEKSIVGGVTLNHLSWASILGVPTGLLALQGQDKSGQLIRKTMKNLNVLTQYLQVSKEFTTGESFVFVQEDGERSIVMATGATSMLNDKIAKQYFEKPIMNDCHMLTTEISQVPLSGVLAVLRTAKAAGVLTVLDLDVSPSVAINEAQLGSIEELKECVRTADILKPAKHAAREMLPYLDPQTKVGNMAELAQAMRDKCGSKLIAITCGEDSSILATENHLVEVPTVPVSNMLDATGAGDAFLGGLISGLYYNGMPNDEDSLRKLGHLGNIVGGACCDVLGALPTHESCSKLEKDLEGLLGIKISKADEASVENLPGFQESMKLDADCVAAISSSIKIAAVEKFVNILENCSGRVLVSGIGKSGIVARRMSASLASTGTPSHFIHAAEWTHGDLGNASPDDVAVFLSHSGNTKECLEVARYLKKRNVPVLTIVGKNSKKDLTALNSSISN